MVFATLIVILVFVPVLFLEGLTGSFFRPLAMAYILAILASLLVALTVTPALSLMLLPGAVDRHRASPLVRGLQAIYRAVLPSWSTASRHRRPAGGLRGERLRRARAGRGVAAQLQGDRLPDALRREAGHERWRR